MAFAQLTRDETVQIPVPTPCDLCDSEEEVNSFCRNCAQKLCETCKRSHLRSTISRDHVVVHISEGSCHFEEPTICREHRNTLGFYCRSCDTLSCPKCLAKHHNGHNFVDTDEYAKEVKRTLSSLLSSKENEREKKQLEIQAIKKAQEDYLTEMDACRSKVKQMTQGLITAILHIKKEFISDINQKESEGIATFEEKLKNTTAQESRLIESIQKLKADAAQQENISLIRTFSGLRREAGVDNKNFSLVVPVVSLLSDQNKLTALLKSIGSLQIRNTNYYGRQSLEERSKNLEFCMCIFRPSTTLNSSYRGYDGYYYCRYCSKRRKDA